MPSVIDELLISIGLDATKFRPGTDEAVRASAKMRDEVTRHAKELQKTIGEDLSDAFTKVTTKVVAFLAVMVGARSMEQFTANVTKSGVALGLMASALGETPQRLSAIGLAVERVGGSSEATWGSLKRLNDVRIAFISWGTAPPEWFQRLGINLRTATNGEDVMNQAVRALERSNYSFDQKRYILEQLGADPFTAQFYLRGGSQQAIAAAAQDAMTAGQVEAAQKLYFAWERASQSAVKMGWAIEERVEPSLSKILYWLADILTTNQQVVSTWVGDRIKDAMDWLKEVNWKGIATSVGDTAKKFNDLVESTLGWKNVLIGLLGLWVAARINPAVQIITSLTTAILGLGNAAARLSGLGLVAGRVGTAVRLGVLGFMAYEALNLYLQSNPDAARRLQENFNRGRTAPPTWKQWFGDLLNAFGLYAPGGHTDAMAKVGRSSGTALVNGVPILVGGMPVSESTPMPVKIIGEVQTVAPPPPPDTPPAGDGTTPPPATHWWSPFTKALGFAEGGSFTVGGRDGRDANRVVLDLTRGERVDVTKPGQSSEFVTKVFDAAKPGQSSEFVTKVFDAARALGLSRPQARLAAAQSGLESGYGMFAPGQNYFGIKAGPDWKGATTNQLTGEQTASGTKYDIHAAFRAYSGLEDSIRDYVQTTKDLWPKMMEGQTFLGAVKGLYHGKYGDYSTDRGYSDKLDAVRDQIQERNNSGLLLGGSRVGVSMHTASLSRATSQSHTNVTIATLSVTNDTPRSAMNDLRRHLSNQLFAQRSDVGLA